MARPHVKGRCICNNLPNQKLSARHGRPVCRKCVDKKTRVKKKLERKARVLVPTYKGFEETNAEQFCNDLKSRATSAETRFKLLFGHLQIPYCFQYPIKREDCDSFYIVDFCMPTINLIVEIDGEYHSDKDQKVKDSLRDQFLASKGYRVIRLTNKQIFNTKTVAALKRRLKLK